MNQVAVVGNITDDAVLRYTQGGAGPRRLHGRGQPRQQAQRRVAGRHRPVLPLHGMAQRR